ncbi:FapA family protein [Thermotoga neapolitana]|uniref:FapA family protein n=1 Tax=Thermotoga neapolitana TaxID=2337 RepID=UPI0022AE8C57|nr:FapA family protein [Thermotoga neapolitana]
MSNTLINLRDSIQKNEQELKRLNEIAEEMAKNAAVIVKEVVYPGVEVVMFNKVFRVEKELTKAVFYYRDGEIRVGGYSE